MLHRMVLDASSLMYRAFFSLPASIVDGEGVPVNAVHGYLDFTARLIRDHRPDQVIHAFDHDWRPAPRVAAYAGYKASRRPDPEGLPEQFPLLREALAGLGMTRVEAPGWEAEDAIGTLCAGGRRGERFDIVTGDRDLIQLVRDPVVRVLFTRRGVSDLGTFDEAGVLAKYGVPANRYADFATLRGDPSDGLPGVPGVGEKTARALVAAYPSVEALVADALREGRPEGALLRRSRTLRPTIRDVAGYLGSMRHVVAIRTDLELSVERDDPDPERLDGLAERHRVTGPVRRLREALAGP